MLGLAVPFFFACGVVAVTASACSSGGSAPVVAIDAAFAGHALGEPCDPLLRPPCVILTDVCSVSICDPASRLCVRVAVDAGPTCSHEPPPHPVPCSAGDCDGSVEAGDAADGGASDAGDAGALDGSNDGAPGDGGPDAAHDAPSEAGDAGGD